MCVGRSQSPKGARDRGVISPNQWWHQWPWLRTGLIKLLESSCINFLELWNSALYPVNEDSAPDRASECAQRGRGCSSQCNSPDTSLHNEALFFKDGVTLTGAHFFTKDGHLQCAGYDTSLRKWRYLPDYLPSFCKPNPDLFKEHLICTKGGIACMDVSKSSEDQLVVFNWLTGECKELPPLNHRRRPVLLHLVVDELTQSYQIIAVGSSKAGDERLSTITEVFDSRTWKWTTADDLPGPGYALNDYQSGVYVGGNLYCIAFLDHEGGRGMLRYNLSKGVWLKNWAYLIPFSSNSTILQLVESSGKIYLFSEQVITDGGDHHVKVEHCVDRVDVIDGGLSLHNVVRVEKIGGPSLEVYPEHVCVPFSKDQLCLFNTITHSGVVYDVENPGRSDVEVLLEPPPANLGGENFFTMNAMSFTIEPSFRCKI